MKLTTMFTGSVRDVSAFRLHLEALADRWTGSIDPATVPDQVDEPAEGTDADGTGGAA
jgi:hypothetical protein